MNMYTIEDAITKLKYEGLKVEKLSSKDQCETLLIVLKKGHWFPEHTSPRDVLLIVLEGDIQFYINNTNYQLQKHQTFTFPANEKHKVFANQNSKFLIVR